MTKKELQKLKSKLPTGYRDALSIETKYSVSFVDKVLSGASKNLKIINAALDLARAHQSELSQISTVIKKL